MSDANEIFLFNLMLARGLLQLVSAVDRQNLKLWLSVLAEMEETEANFKIRNEYIYFILLMLQNNKIEDFFKEPPPAKIKPLDKVIPKDTIDEVLIAADQNTSWQDHVPNDEHEKQTRVKKRKVAPEYFLQSQPMPKEGVFCYFGAFSDQS